MANSIDIKSLGTKESLGENYKFLIDTKEDSSGTSDLQWLSKEAFDVFIKTTALDDYVTTKNLQDEVANAFSEDFTAEKEAITSAYTIKDNVIIAGYTQSDTNLQSNIDDEAKVREEADGVLQNNIDILKGYDEDDIDSKTVLGNNNAIKAEETAREEADGVLRNNIDVLKGGNEWTEEITLMSNKATITALEGNADTPGTVLGNTAAITANAFDITALKGDGWTDETVYDNAEAIAANTSDIDTLNGRVEILENYPNYESNIGIESCNCVDEEGTTTVGALITINLENNKIYDLGELTTYTFDDETSSNDYYIIVKGNMDEDSENKVTTTEIWFKTAADTTTDGENITLPSFTFLANEYPIVSDEEDENYEALDLTNLDQFKVIEINESTFSTDGISVDTYYRITIREEYNNRIIMNKAYSYNI